MWAAAPVTEWTGLSGTCPTLTAPGFTSISTGTFDDAAGEPLPSWPEAFEPHAQTVPSFRSA